MLEADLVAWLSDNLEAEVFYQHINHQPTSPFVWFSRSGDETFDTLDGDGEPDVVYFNLEIYSDDLGELQSLSSELRSHRDYRGSIGTGYVDDIGISDQIDDYQFKATADSLPEFSTSFRLIVTGYAP
jgi:hypothetical protein